jgi:osmotically-inducible protein OsmY
MMNRCTLTAIVTAALLIAGSGAAHAQSTFSDVPDNHWAAAAVETLAQAGIIEGYAAGQPSEPSRKDSPTLTMARVKSALTQDKRLDASSINVSINDTTLMLTGTANSRLERDMAGQIAASNAGDLKVLNRLLVAPKVRGR